MFLRDEAEYRVDHQKFSHTRKSNILSLPSHQRPREKLIKSGSHNLTDIELMSVVLGSGIRDKNVFELARQVLEVLNHTSIEDENLYEKLISVKGIGHSKACMLNAIFEITKRKLSSQALKILTPKEIYRLLNDYTHKKREYFIAIYLNKNRELLNKNVLAIGNENRAFISAKEIFHEALLLQAGMIILAHNHPSGRLKPSPKDINITKKLARMGKLLDIRIIDHIIISPQGYFSFYQNQLI